MCRFTNIICLFLFSLGLNAQNQSLIYINKYKHVALSEMNRSGIPASIKMAQALLESGAGQSTLAEKANNHFGIKCGGDWSGKTYYREDDDYNKEGKLIKSCFRKFKNADASYYAHSEFLMNQPRYASLFSLSPSDYHGWAYGLKDAGYAADKRYPQKLIDIIEKYELYNIDKNMFPAIFAEANNHKESNLETEEVLASDENRRSQSSRRASNKRKSKKTKRSKNGRSSKTYHIVEGAQTIEEIASIYRIKENLLRIRNRLPKDAQPIKGEKLYLRKKISLLRRPKFIRVADGALASNEFIF